MEEKLNNIGEVGDCGYLKIENNEDRALVANILYKNGYTLSPVRRKRNGKTYEYFVRYEIKSKDIKDYEN